MMVYIICLHVAIALLIYALGWVSARTKGADGPMGEPGPQGPAGREGTPS